MDSNILAILIFVSIMIYAIWPFRKDLRKLHPIQSSSLSGLAIGGIIIWLLIAINAIAILFKD